MSRCLPLWVFALGFSLVACGGSPCRRACKHLAVCSGADPDAGIAYRSSAIGESAPGTSSGGFTCALSRDCPAKEACVARCIEKASCPALLGTDPEGAAKLGTCQLACQKLELDGGETETDPPPISDGGPVSCEPSCADRECGDDGCGGSCGICIYPAVCGGAGTCTTSCSPSCSGKQCGSDGCGGSCGTCAYGKTCSSGVCVSTCTPSCSGKECGSDGCGGSCGTCAYGETCSGGLCIGACTPCCAGKQCGSDGCSGSCGTCPSGYTCNSSGLCQASSSGCGSVSVEGCCSGSTLKYCDGTQVQTVSCASSPSCGWDSSSGYYDCGTAGGSDPSGLHPRTCY